MDDLQFNASLDALLDTDNMNSDGSAGTNSYSAFPGSINMQNPAPVKSGGHHSGGPLGMQVPGLPYGAAAPGVHGPYQGIPNFASLSTYPGGQRSGPVPSGDASSIASSTPSGRSRSTRTSSRKHLRDVSAVSEDEEERVRRRQDRNMREQQRSQKITEQIDHLKDVLSSANVPFKPDKYSTLVSVAEYIQQLQERSTLLDIEHKKLVDTISRTNEMVNDRYMPASTTGADAPGSANLEGGTEGEHEDLFVPNVDYKTVFSRCGVPLAILSIDGRFLDCNLGFEQLTGYTREELFPAEKAEMVASSGDAQKNDLKNMSLFNLLCREHMEIVFMAMSEMLKQPPVKRSEKNSEESLRKDYWSGMVRLSRNMDVEMHMNVSLVRNSKGRAKSFDCSLTPVEVETDALIGLSV